MSGLRLRNSYIVTGIVWSALLLFALLASVGLVSTLESRYAALGQAAPFPLQTYAATNESWTGNDPRIRRTLKNEHGSISALYSFVSFNNDPIEVKTSVQSDAYDAYRQTFGYRQQELDDLFDQQKDQLEKAQAWAIKNRASQQQLDKISTNINNTYNRAVKNLIRSRGFRFLNENLLAADIPEIVSNNVALFRPIALSLQKTMRKLGYSDTDTIGTALPLVQTAIAYEALPKEQNGRITAGFSPPLEVFMEGRGDCDAKSALLASILLNWDKVKLIGVGVPGHYLLGILQHPAKGDAFIEYEGLTYVLMEPSGPAWVPPGVVSDYTLKWLDSQNQVILEPITLN
jgi:hypothetical protein